MLSSVEGGDISCLNMNLSPCYSSGKDKMSPLRHPESLLAKGWMNMQTNEQTDINL